MNEELAKIFINQLFDFLDIKTKKYQVFNGLVLRWARELALKSVAEIMNRMYSSKEYIAFYKKSLQKVTYAQGGGELPPLKL